MDESQSNHARLKEDKSVYIVWLHLHKILKNAN